MKKIETLDAAVKQLYTVVNETYKTEQRLTNLVEAIRNLTHVERIDLNTAHPYLMAALLDIEYYYSEQE